MLTSKTIAAAAAAIAFTAVGMQAAQAAPRDHGFYGRHAEVSFVNMRIRGHSRRIRRAYRRGPLNWVQARRARFELSHIRGFRARYVGDGRLSFRESRHLHRLLDRNHRRIRRMARGNSGNWRRARDDFRFDRIEPRRPRLSRFDGFR